MSERAKCELCGEPMPEGEEMFKFHGYSGPCPKPPLPRIDKQAVRDLEMYRSGYSCGYSDATSGTPMRDEAAGRLFLNLPADAS
jgi:hypothetical protein